MSEVSNPYASSVPVERDGEHLYRPLGTIVLAGLLLLFGALLLLLCAHQAWKIWSVGAPVRSALYMSRGIASLGSIALVALAAGIGLLLGRRVAWWLAMGFCYLSGSFFVVVPLLRFGASVRQHVWLAILSLVWLYLHKKNVRDYFAIESLARWRWHAAIAVISLVFIFAVW
jgi:hypothetical protein